MHGTSKKLLEKFVTNVADSAISIILVGSHALGNAHQGSDIDLIVLTKHQKDVEYIENIGKELNRSESRPVIDSKVFTESKFSSMKAGLENRFLWTCLSTGKVLSGEDITKTVQLVPMRVSESYWKHVQSVENACRNLDTGIQYTGSCYSLYDALSTTYFVDRFIFYSIKDGINKEEYIKSHLGSEFSMVRDRFYWIVSRIETATSRSSLRVQNSIDQKFKRNDYKLMYERALDINKVIQYRYKEIKNWSE